MKTSVIFKGKKDGLELHVSEYQEFETFITLVESKLKAMGEFLQTSQMQMQVYVYGNFTLTTAEEATLINLLRKYSLKYAGKKAKGARPVSKKTELEDKPIEREVNFATEDKNIIEKDSCLIVYKNLRSGQYIGYHMGSVIVIGDVNPGAKIAAEGDIIITGTTRGELHAGVLGDDRATITAKNIVGGQLRISTKIAIAGDNETSNEKGMERAIVENGDIVVIKL